MRVWVGLVVLVAGVVLAVLHFQAPPEPAAIEKILLAQQSDEALTTSSIVAGGAGGAAAGSATWRQASGSWERRSIVVGRRDVTAGGTIIDTDPEPPSGYELVRALQAELQRVGCYRGAVDGDWGPMSRRAMRGFTDRVNASLPVDQPDHVLYRMVQGYEGQACGSCPSGEALNVAGRCVPAALLARDSETGEGGADQRRAEPLPGRMSIGGPLEAVDAGESLTREGAEEARSRSRRSAGRPRVADHNSPPPSYRPPQERKRWAERFFEELSRR